MSLPVFRVSIIRFDPDKFETIRDLMVESEAILAPGIRSLPGGRLFFAGADPDTSSLINVSLWDTLEDARQLDRFQPMLDLGKRFIEAGARFERPVMNYAPLWQLTDLASREAA